VAPRVILTRRTFGLAALAQSSGSTVFVPNAAPPSTAKGRSPDRERNPSTWGISDDQWGLFQAFAAARPMPLKAVVRLNNLRARQFKDDLAELLASISGWEVEDQGLYTAGTLPAFDGILIQNRSAVEPSPEALLIKQALDAAGIEPKAQFDATQPGLLRILIGAPPRR
jgi:hypothetical protein